MPWVNSGLIQIHAELEESAQMSGATTWQGFRRISVPLLAPTLLYAWLWIALLIFRELTLAVILSTADNLTFPVVVWSLWLGGGLGQPSALPVVMLLMMTPMIVIYWLLPRQAKNHSSQLTETAKDRSSRAIMIE